jgi:hypothetical protein
MINEQLQEGNKLIFEVTKFNQAVERDEVPEFHNYWNQLMGAVQTIQSMGYRFLLDSNEERIEARFTDMGIPSKVIVEVVSRNSNLEAIWSLCVAFSKWYKSQVQ